MSELSLVRRGGGKRSATGTVTVPAGTKSFTNSYGSTYTAHYVSVTGLGFQPSTIVCIGSGSPSTSKLSVAVFIATGIVAASNTANIINLAGTVSGNSIADCGGMFWKLAADAAVTDDGFVLPVNADVGQTITYYALE